MWILIWLALSVIAGIIASNKERSFFGFLLLALLLSPVVGILAAVIAKPNIAAHEQKVIASGLQRKCPHCAELVKNEASTCKHCGKEIAPLLQQTCPHCGHTDTPWGEKYCYWCERRLT